MCIYICVLMIYIYIIYVPVQRGTVQSSFAWLSLIMVRLKVYLSKEVQTSQVSLRLRYAMVKSWVVQGLDQAGARLAARDTWQAQSRHGI